MPESIATPANPNKKNEIKTAPVCTPIFSLRSFIYAKSKFIYALSKFIYALSKFIYALRKFIYAKSKFCSARVQMPFPATRHIPAFAVIEIKKPPTVHSTNNAGCKPVWLPSCFSRCFQISLISISYQKVFCFLGVPLRKTGNRR
jgi:hypothetical protein